MIEVRNLTKTYGDRLAVNDISFSVGKGEVLGFLGQNGAGKTTTMKILTCFMAATSGSVKVAGFDVLEQPHEVKKRIGYLPENPPLYMDLLVEEYLSFVADLKQVPGSEKTSKISAVLERCKLGDVRRRLIGNLSKGYRQRVGLAQALIHDPEVLVLDEPTVGLDPKQVSEFRSLIQGMRSGRTVIYSTHILSEVAATCDRIVVIDKGRIAAEQAMGSFKTEGNTEVVVQRLTDGLLENVKKIKGVRSARAESNGAHRMIVETDGNPEVLSDIAKAVVSGNAGLVKLAPMQQGLEEYYLGIISGRRSEQ